MSNFPLTPARPEELGMAGDRLDILSTIMRGEVERGNIPGGVLMVARHGKLALTEAFGFRNREKELPMQLDSIFPIASLTKPIVSTLAMRMVERGQLSLVDSVSRHVPEFAGRQVVVERDGQAVTEPAAREATLRDLMRHTAGLTHIVNGDGPVQRTYKDAKVRRPDQTTAQMAAILASMPLAHQPGTTCEYSMALDLLGYILEKTGGQQLGELLALEMFAPLGMTDTGFRIPADKLSRAARTAPGSAPLLFDVDNPPQWDSGGGGLFSTASDYMRFAQMSLDDGSFESSRILSGHGARRMHSPALPAGVAYAPVTHGMGIIAPTPEMGQSFGLGFCVRLTASGNPAAGSVGDYYWSGGYGSYFWIDPVERLVAVWLCVSPSNRQRYRSILRDVIYSSLTELEVAK